MKKKINLTIMYIRLKMDYDMNRTTELEISRLLNHYTKSGAEEIVTTLKQTSESYLFFLP